MPTVLKVGASVAGVAGLVALVCGLVAMVLGTVGALAGRRWWTKVAAVPAVVAVGFCVLTPLVVAMTATNAPPLRLGDRTPADVGLAHTEVELRTADGEHLRAWYVPSTNGAAVALLAGAGSTRDDELDHAAVLARNGYGVLLLDVRGHGGSSGEAMQLGWWGEVDVVPAIDHLAARPDVVDGRIGIVGMSMGAQQAVAAAGVDDRIRAVVAEGVVGRNSDELDAPTPIDAFLGWATMQVSELITTAPHPTPLVDAVAAAAPNPVLVIAGGKVGIERDFAEELRSASPSTVEVWVAPGTGHTGAYGEHPAEWEARVTAFLGGRCAELTERVFPGGSAPDVIRRPSAVVAADVDAALGVEVAPGRGFPGETVRARMPRVARRLVSEMTGKIVAAASR